MKLFHTKEYKVISSLIYGWGACIVIIGALFKIMHFPGAGIILTVGMLVEAFIFFFSAFEPQMEHYDWTRVFPQLGKNEEGPKEGLSGMVSVSGNYGEGLEQQDIDKLKKGISKFADTADSFSSIAEHVPEVTRNMDQIAATFNRLSTQSQQAGETLEDTTRKLSSGCEEWKQTLLASVQNLSEEIGANCSKLTEGMAQSGERFVALSKLMEEKNLQWKAGTEEYRKELSELTRHIAALNALYEINLKETEEGMKAFGKVREEASKTLQHISGSLENAGRFQQESEGLAEKVASLNTIYGNMLSLVNNN